MPRSKGVSLLAGALAIVAAACAPREPPAPPPALPPPPRIAEAPPGTVACSGVPAEAGWTERTLRARLAFAGCHSEPCPPCPPEVTCSPCAPGYCTFVGDTPAEAACELQISGASPECRQMIPGAVYVTKLESGGGSLYAAACWELAGAPRVDLDAARAAKQARIAGTPPLPGASSNGATEQKGRGEPGRPERGRRYPLVFSFVDPGDGRDTEAERMLLELVRTSQHPPLHVRGRWGSAGEHDECFDQGAAFMEWMSFRARAITALEGRPKVRRSFDAPCRDDAP